MCASALRQYRIRAVYFGCLNERFGGCGGVMRLCSDPSIDPPYPVYGGIFREEAIMLLRRFYVQENDKGTSRLSLRSQTVLILLSPGTQTQEESRIENRNLAGRGCTQSSRPVTTIDYTYRTKGSRGRSPRGYPEDEDRK